MSFYSKEDGSDIESVTVDQHAPRHYLPTLPSIPAQPADSPYTFDTRGSIGITSGPARIDPKAKIVGEFRTLRSVVPAQSIVYLTPHLLSVYMSPTQKKVMSIIKGRKISLVSRLPTPPLPSLSPHPFKRPLNPGMAHPLRV